MISETNNAESSAEVAALKNQIFVLLLALIVVSGTLTVFLFRQVSLTNKDMAQGQRMAAILNQNETGINAFLNKLVVYGQKHPEFRPVLLKYGITPPPAGIAAPAAPKK